LESEQLEAEQLAAAVVEADASEEAITPVQARALDSGLRARTQASASKPGLNQRPGEVLWCAAIALCGCSMDARLSSLEVLVLDCQAAGATPAHGDLLELGWSFCGASGLDVPVNAHWIARRSERPIPRAVRELTGWTEASAAQAIAEEEAWSRLCAAIEARSLGQPMPTVIHFARFELGFLRELHARLGPGGDFPFDTLCLHAIAARLFPDLPRRNIRALAGFLGHSTELVRRAGGHVLASAHIWRALLPYLEQAGVHTWLELDAWLKTASVAKRSKRRVYPLAAEKRRALPDRPGVYRFVRSNESVLYVGKATSLRKRIAQHFSGKGPGTERGLELLSQVHDIVFTQTDSVLEAALLESDEIKRIDPPYNVQLRAAERCAWFAARDGSSARPEPSDEHPVGPLSSENALLSLGAWHKLVATWDDTAQHVRAAFDPSPGLCALALSVPSVFLPEPALFIQGFELTMRECFAPSGGSSAIRVANAARALWLARGRQERESSEDMAPNEWDLARVRRRLERSLVQGGLCLRRARWLGLLAHAQIAFREPSMPAPRVLHIERGHIVERAQLRDLLELRALPLQAAVARRERQRCFDAATYDRMRVLATECSRVLQEGGELSLRIGKRVYEPARTARLLLSV
jgi:DNA polymerase-3 subunit epsilon